MKKQIFFILMIYLNMSFANTLNNKNFDALPLAINDIEQCESVSVLTNDKSLKGNNVLFNKTVLKANGKLYLTAPFSGNLTSINVGFDEYLLLHFQDEHKNIYNLLIDNILIISNITGAVEKDQRIAEIIINKKLLSINFLLSNINIEKSISESNQKILNDMGGGNIIKHFKCIK